MVLDRVAIYGALLMELWHEHREINAEQDAKDPISLTGQHKAPSPHEINGTIRNHRGIATGAGSLYRFLESAECATTRIRN